MACDPTTVDSDPGSVSLMAAGQFRDALAAAERGDYVDAAASLVAIDADSWRAIERRLAGLGGTIPHLLAKLSAPTEEGASK